MHEGGNIVAWRTLRRRNIGKGKVRIEILPGESAQYPGSLARDRCTGGYPSEKIAPFPGLSVRISLQIRDRGIA